MSSTPTSLRTILQRRREALGLSRDTLAARAGLSPDGIRLIEDGHRPTPRFVTVAAIARALGLRLDDLAQSSERAPRSAPAADLEPNNTT
jgi:transcriptional regulator with XRE-family HTH domain